MLLDSGIRRGTDIFKAIALGANAVLVGRPQVYALAVAGALGVAHMLRLLREELEVTMALERRTVSLFGCPTLASINSEALRPERRVGQNRVRQARTMLIPIHKVLTKDLVHQLRETLGHGQWLDGRLPLSGQRARRRAASNRISKWTINLNRRSMRAIKFYTYWGDTSFFCRRPCPIKYFSLNSTATAPVRDRYGAHIDNAIMPMSGTNEMLRTDLSVTLFLSEPDEYEGGELTVETMYGAQEIKLNAGDMILYPSTSLHHVTDPRLPAEPEVDLLIFLDTKPRPR